MVRKAILCFVAVLAPLLVVFFPGQSTELIWLSTANPTPPECEVREIALSNFAWSLAQHDLWKKGMSKNLSKIISMIENEPTLLFKWAQVTYSCEGLQLRRYGNKGDGGKWVCAFENLKQPCLIYSLGSNNDFSFELDAFADTKCEIHTFDCTMSPVSLPRQVTFHKWCIGATQVLQDRQYLSYTDVLQRLNHTKVNFIKADIEGFEFQVLPNLLSVPACQLPQQISFEMHLQRIAYAKPPEGFAQAGLRLLMLLDQKGYLLFSKEANPGCPFCYEFVYVLREDIAASCLHS